MAPRVYDIYGNEQDLEWLADRYDGCTFLPATTDGATEVWRLQAVFCTTGPAVLKAETRNKRGQAANNQPVVMTYPSLANPSPDLDDLTAYQTRWADRGRVHRTNMDGLFGFGLGSAYGPLYHVWVLSSAPSDCLTGTGMKGGTEHEGPLHGVWGLEDVEPTFDDLPAALLWHGERNQVIEFNPSAAIQKRIFADGYVPNSPEFGLEFQDWEFVAQRAEDLATGAVRIYYCERDDWENVRFVAR